MKIRSFLAFELPGEMKSIVSQVSQGLRPFPLNVRWVRETNIHLTVVFMGEVPSEQLESIEETVSRVCQASGPFHIWLKGVGLFPGMRKPRVLWIGVEGDIERLGEFRDALQEGLVPFGVKEERRPFRPHLTLGRFKKGGKGDRALVQALDRFEGLTSPRETLSELALFKSELKRDGAVYTRLKAWPLGTHQ